jgi:hypothetical protein
VKVVSRHPLPTGPGSRGAERIDGLPGLSSPAGSSVVAGLGRPLDGGLETGEPTCFGERGRVVELLGRALGRLDDRPIPRIRSEAGRIGDPVDWSLGESSEHPLRGRWIWHGTEWPHAGI